MKDGVASYDFYLFENPYLEPRNFTPMTVDQGDYAGTTISVNSVIVTAPDYQPTVETVPWSRPTIDGLNMQPEEFLQPDMNVPDGQRGPFGEIPQDVDTIPLPDDLTMPDGFEREMPPQSFRDIPIPITGRERVTNGRPETDPSMIPQEERDLPESFDSEKMPFGQD